MCVIFAVFYVELVVWIWINKYYRIKCSTGTRQCLHAHTCDAIEEAMLLMDVFVVKWRSSLRMGSTSRMGIDQSLNFTFDRRGHNKYLVIWIALMVIASVTDDRQREVREWRMKYVSEWLANSWFYNDWYEGIDQINCLHKKHRSKCFQWHQLKWTNCRFQVPYWSFLFIENEA